MPRHKQAERQEIMSETRQRLLQAAAGEFARQGFNGANVNSISTAAGFAKGTIYNYFSSKEALMLALIDQIAAQHIAYIAAQVRQAQAPPQRLERFFAAGFEFIQRSPDQVKVIVSTLYGPDTAFKLHMFLAYQPLFHLVQTDILEAGVRQGSFRPVDIPQTQALLLTLYLGSSITLNEENRVWLDPGHVAAFALQALRIEGNPE